MSVKPKDSESELLIFFKHLNQKLFILKINIRPQFEKKNVSLFSNFKTE